MRYALPAVLSLVATLAAPAAAKEKISYALMIDPVVEAFTYAMKTGKVTSDLIDVDMTALSIPAAIQATATKQYDVQMAAVISIPRAKAIGLDLTVLSVAIWYPRTSRGGDIWVRNDSPYKSIPDLKGKTIAVSSLDSTGTTWVRLALWKKYGVNVGYDGGDFQWVEIAAGSQPGALATGKVEASTLIHSQALLAMAGQTFHAVTSTPADTFATLGVDEVSAVNASYPEKLAARPQAFIEFDRLLKASRDYALSHPEEIAGIITKAGLPADFFEKWTKLIGDFPATIGPEDIASMEANWQASKELGLIDSYPEAKSVVWNKALQPAR